MWELSLPDLHPGGGPEAGEGRVGPPPVTSPSDYLKQTNGIQNGCGSGAGQGWGKNTKNMGICVDIGDFPICLRGKIVDFPISPRTPESDCPGSYGIHTSCHRSVVGKRTSFQGQWRCRRAARGLKVPGLALFGTQQCAKRRSKG